MQYSLVEATSNSLIFGTPGINGDFRNAILLYDHIHLAVVGALIVHFHLVVKPDAIIFLCLSA